MENEAAEVITEETAAASPVQAAEPAPQKQKKTAAKKPAAKKPAAKTAKKTTSKKTAKPSGKLVIVESPAKAKTIQKYLGKGYQVMASMGHIRDLPKSRLAVDVENGFKPEYIDIRGTFPICWVWTTSRKTA